MNVVVISSGPGDWQIAAPLERLLFEVLRVNVEGLEFANLRDRKKAFPSDVDFAVVVTTDNPNSAKADYRWLQVHSHLPDARIAFYGQRSSFHHLPGDLVAIDMQQTQPALSLLSVVGRTLDLQSDETWRGHYDRVWTEIRSEAQRDMARAIDAFGLAKTLLTRGFGGALSLYLDAGDATESDVLAVLSAINRLHVAAGGKGLIFSLDGEEIRVAEGALP